MNLFLAHGNVEWIAGGLIAFIGIMVFIFHIVRGHVLHVVLSAMVWFFVFSMHKGSTAGIMTATLAALLFDVFGIPLIKLFMKFK